MNRRRVGAKSMFHWSRGQLLVALLLSACAQIEPQQSPTTNLPAAPLPAIQSRPTAPPNWPALAVFEQKQRTAAEAAVAQKRWADAALAWDILLALHPGDAELRRQQTRAQGNAQQDGAERLLSAQQAHQRGENDAAARGYLEALSLLPGQEAAAEGLRTLERERSKRQHLGQLSRNTLLRRARNSTDGAPQVDQLVAGATGTGVSNNDLEHASLLAAQGEIDAAIALLVQHADNGAADPAARRLLAELYFRKADKLASTDAVAAASLLQQSLALDGSLSRAFQLLKELEQNAHRRVPRKPSRETSP